MPHMVGVRGLRVILLGAAAALVPAACSGTATGTTPSTATTSPPTTTTVARVTTTTAAPPPTTTATTTTVVTTTTADPLARPDKLVSNFDRSSVDDFDTTGDDLYRVVMELVDLFNYLEGNPTGTGEDMAGFMFERDYPFWDPIVLDFDELVQNPGWHYVDAGIRVLAIEVISVDGDTATVKIADERGEQLIADADKQIVRQFPGWERKVSTFTFARGSDRRWRFAALTPSQPISDEDLAMLTPVDWKGRTP